MQDLFSVDITNFAQKYFIKSFRKKYRSHWDATLVAIISSLERIDSLVQTDRGEIITRAGDIQIVKVSFSVAKSKESASSSGNRCIVAWNVAACLVSILLVYHKNDLSGHNETAEWKKLIKENYPEYRDLM